MSRPKWCSQFVRWTFNILCADAREPEKHRKGRFNISFVEVIGERSLYNKCNVCNVRVFVRRLHLAWARSAQHKSNKINKIYTQPERNEPCYNHYINTLQHFIQYLSHHIQHTQTHSHTDTNTHTHTHTTHTHTHTHTTHTHTQPRKQKRQVSELL